MAPQIEEIHFIRRGAVESKVKELLRQYADRYNDRRYFEQDPVSFPRHFVTLLEDGKATLQDVEIAGLLAAHLAWGRRSMIVRDCNRMFDEMEWKPFEYVMSGDWRCEDCALHRTVKWSEFAAICRRFMEFYSDNESLEHTSPDGVRTLIFGQKSDLKAANKKIHMFRRWMVRRDGIVDFGLWRETDPADLIIPLDVHVHTTAVEMGITSRRSADFSTALEITAFFRELFPEDPCKGDFALFGYGVTGGGNGKIVDN